MSLAGELFDCVIQYAQFGLFQYVPDSLATVDTVVAPLVAVLAKGYTGVLEPLFDMVGIRGFRSSTNPAGQRFYRRQVPSLGGGQLIVHLSNKTNLCQPSISSYHRPTINSLRLESLGILRWLELGSGRTTNIGYLADRQTDLHPALSS